MPGPTFLSKLFGKHYAAAISTAERTVLTFVTAFLAKLFAGGLDVGGIGHVSNWQAAAVAGIAAAVVFVQSVLTAALTGVPSSASLVSNTIRSRRDLGGRKMAHTVPLRPRRRA